MLRRLKNIIAPDSCYREMAQEYTVTDGWIAIGFYVAFIVVYFLIGVVKANYGIYLGVPVNLLLTIACILIVLFRKQKLSTIGITALKIKKSLLLGTADGFALVLFGNVLPGLLSGSHLNSVKNSAIGFLYYFVVIALTEEVVFRGFIQTRIYGLIKNDIAAVITVGVLFSAMHIPYQAAASGKGFLEFIQTNSVWLLILVLWHVVFNFLYRKYNSLMADTVFHGFMDWGNSLFL